MFIFDCRQLCNRLFCAISLTERNCFSNRRNHKVSKDPDDDKFIECAVVLDAKYIISGDKALLAVKNYMGIRVLSPREFL